MRRCDACVKLVDSLGHQDTLHTEMKTKQTEITSKCSFEQLSKEQLKVRARKSSKKMKEMDRIHKAWINRETIMIENAEANTKLFKYVSLGLFFWRG
jgi:3-dehydroquinate dehydratase